VLLLPAGDCCGASCCGGCWAAAHSSQAHMASLIRSAALPCSQHTQEFLMHLTSLIALLHCLASYQCTLTRLPLNTIGSSQPPSVLLVLLPTCIWLLMTLRSAAERSWKSPVRRMGLRLPINVLTAPVERAAAMDRCINWRTPAHMGRHNSDLI
jgi:hypothetical protein